MGSVEVACVVVPGEHEAERAVRAWAAEEAPGLVLWLTAAPVARSKPRNVRHLTYSEVMRTAGLLGGYSLLHSGLSVGTGVVVLDDMQLQGLVDDVERGAGVALAVNPDATPKAVVRSGAVGPRHPGRATGVTCVETGREFPSIAEAARVARVSRQAVGKALDTGGRAGGLHWARSGVLPACGDGPVRCVDDGRTFDDAAAAAAVVGVPVQAVSIAAEHGIRCRGLLWEVVDEIRE